MHSVRLVMGLLIGLASSAALPAQEVIFENFNKASVTESPTAPTTLRVSAPVRLGSILTYHWNRGRGKSPGTISLRRADGTVLGPWSAEGQPGQGGVPNANWVAYPGVVLEPGEYTVVDSDPATWSHNGGSRGRGFVQLHGAGGAAAAAYPGARASSSRYLRLDRDLYHLGERLRVHFTRPPDAPDRAWIGLFPAGTPHTYEEANGKELAYKRFGDKRAGTFEFSLPEREGDFEVRIMSSPRELDVLPFRIRFRTHGASVAVRPPPVFYPGREIVVPWTMPEVYQSRSWIGLFAASTPKPYEEANGKELAYKRVGAVRRGEMRFQAPKAVGDYDFRLIEREREVARAPFTVALLRGDSSLRLPKRHYYPGTPLPVTFTVPEIFPRNSWIGIFQADAPRPFKEANGKELTYKYLQGQTQGALEFAAPQKVGEYELRLMDRRQEVLALPFEVRLLRGGASLEVLALEPKVKVRFTVPEYFPSNSWVGIFPADTPRPFKQANGKETTYKYLQGQRSGLLELDPPGPGRYEVRLMDRRQEVVAVAMDAGARARAPGDPRALPLGVEANDHAASRAAGRPGRVRYFGDGAAAATARARVTAAAPTPGGEFEVAGPAGAASGTSASVRANADAPEPSEGTWSDGEWGGLDAPPGLPPPPPPVFGEGKVLAGPPAPPEAPPAGRGGPPTPEAVATGVGGARVVAAPGLAAAGGRPTVRPVDTPEAPDGITPKGQAYEVELEGGGQASAGILVELPVPPDVLAAAGDGPVKVAHLHEGAWKILPARVVNGRAVVEVEHLSLFMLVDTRTPGGPSAADLLNMNVPAPSLFGVRLTGEQAVAWLDVSSAYLLYPKGAPRLPYTVKELQVFVSEDKPHSSKCRAGHRVTPVGRATCSQAGCQAKVETRYQGNNAMTPLTQEGTPVVLPWRTRWAKVPIPFGPDTGVTALGDTSVQACRSMYVAVRPVFANGSVGPLGVVASIPSEVVQAMLALRRGMLQRMTPSDHAAFRDATKARPFWFFYNRAYMTRNEVEAYMPNSGAIKNWLSSYLASGQRNESFTHMLPVSDFYRVVTHEWGHYALHAAYGDTAFERLPGGSHDGWVEATPDYTWTSGGSWYDQERAMAWSEGLATFLGQWGTGHGVPASTGAMGGRWGGVSRHPDNGLDVSRWPQAPSMDSTRVESIWASLLSRQSKQFGFAGVWSKLTAGKPRDGLKFLAAWLQGQPSAETDHLQHVALDEGLAWPLFGRIVGRPLPDADPEPLEGVKVRIQALGGKELQADPATVPLKGASPPSGEAAAPEAVAGDTLQLASGATGTPPYRPVATTGKDGRFFLWVPPGDFRVVAEVEGWAVDPGEKRPFFQRRANPANRPNVSLAGWIPEDFLMVPEVLPEVTITAPAPGEVLTEKTVEVTGTVTGTKDGLPDGDPIETLKLVLGGEVFETAVTDGSFSQKLLLTPGENVIRAVAQNDLGRGEASVKITADIEATILKVVLTWRGADTDIDLWVTDPGGVTTGYTDKTPDEGRELDIDDTSGHGPETYTMTKPLTGSYKVRVHYYSGEGGESFRVRWISREGTEKERRGSRSGSLGEEGDARSFTINVQ